MKVSLLSLLALVALVSAPSVWAAPGDPCEGDGDCGSDESCSLISDTRICAVRGGLGSTCDDTTVCGEFLACVQGICTFSAGPDNNGTDGNPTQVIPAGEACQIFDFDKQCIAEYFCNTLSGTCESLTVQSCTVTTLGTPGSGGCKSTQVCTPIDFLNTNAGAPGACITVEQDPNSHVCNPACPVGQTCALGLCINDDVGQQCAGGCPTGQICVGNVCTDDVASCPTEGCGVGKSCVAGVCVADVATCPAEGCGAGKSCVAGICVTDVATCPTEGCGAGKTCVAGVCVTDIATCPAEGCGAGKSCIAGVCVTDVGTCPAEGCGAGKSCVAGVCVADSVVPATCNAQKLCPATQQCVAGVCVPGTGAQDQCSPACTTGNTCIGTVCVADGTAFTGALGSRCDAAHGCNTGLTCFIGVCAPSGIVNGNGQFAGASTVHATVSVLVSLAIACVAALMTV